MKKITIPLLYLTLLTLATLSSAFLRQGAFPKEGNWKAHLQTEGQEVALNLEVRGTHADNARVFLITGNERLELQHFSAKGDSLVIEVPAYQAHIRVKVEKERLSGFYLATQGDQTARSFPFRAIHGQKNETTQALTQLTNRYSLNQSTALR
jgi:hypothetical protein